jgi:hypothetical protein
MDFKFPYEWSYMIKRRHPKRVETLVMCAKCWDKQEPRPAYYTRADEEHAYKHCAWCGDLTSKFRNVDAKGQAN